MTDAFVKASEPFWGTALALLDALGAAQAGTLLFALFVFIAALELLRSGSGLVAHAARAIAIAALGLGAATFVYGDYLAPPAAALVSQAGIETPRHDHALVAVLGAAAAGFVYRSGRKEGMSRRGMHWQTLKPSRSVRAASRETLPSVVVRLQQRLASHNPKRMTPRVYRAVGTAPVSARTRRFSNTGA